MSRPADTGEAFGGTHTRTGCSAHLDPHGLRTPARLRDVGVGLLDEARDGRVVGMEASENAEVLLVIGEPCTRRARGSEGVARWPFGRVDEVVAHGEAREHEGGVCTMKAISEVEVLQAPTREVTREATHRGERGLRDGEVPGVGEAPGLIEPVEVVEAGAQRGLARPVRDDP